MKKVSKKELLDNLKFYLSEIKQGKIFIYPTDTILGIGCNALNRESVEKIFEIKKRENKPFLVIAPDFDWIKKNCKVKEEDFNKIKGMLPGPYSFIVKIKNKDCIDSLVNLGKDTMGVRMPDSWFFYKVLENNNIPFVTTSVNISGQESFLKISDISKEILNQIDYLVDDDSGMRGISSTIIKM